MKNLVIVRGGGDIATGTIYKLYKCGFKVLILEVANPSAIRREVAFGEAVYEGIKAVEDVICYLASDYKEAKQMITEGKLTILVDPSGTCIEKLKPIAVVDAILAKKNLGTNKEMADIVIGLGPGFEAGVDVHAVIETMRGHNLGRIIYNGKALANTGIPAKICGYGKERVIKCPAEGVLISKRHISDQVKKGDVVAIIQTEKGDVPIEASIDGILRGMIRDNYYVSKGFKIADIDPRLSEKDNCFTISDKARCIGGGVLEAIMNLRR